jgi:ATP-dependent Zn protease
MDGFKPTDNILVIGATNNYDILDPAAIRPGRFDHKIYIPLPDMKGREDILELYLSKIVHNFGKKELTIDINVKHLAQMTPGFSGAEIKNLVNLAIIHAVKENK